MTVDADIVVLLAVKSMKQNINISSGNCLFETCFGLIVWSRPL